MENAKGSFLLQVEGVNLYQVMGDTQNINVIRGASMALRDAISKVDKWLKKLNPGICAIQTGASVGLFFLPVNEATARNCLNEIIVKLNSDDLLKHFTFSADIQTLTDFKKDRERLLAKIRFRQLQQVSLSLPDSNPSNTVEPCPLEGIRPATETKMVKNERTCVSASVAARLDYGRDSKKKFFERETGNVFPGGFTDDLSEISLGLRRVYPQLNGKLAYVYADGNSFRNIIKAAVERTGANPLELNIEFDQYIQGKRKEFLRKFVSEGFICGDFLTVDGHLRMEVLMWGGDEFLMVVPAWLGFHTLSAFFQCAAGWNFREQKLTHAAGLVFCHHKTPVYRIRQLAQNLADDVKRVNREKNLFNYMVLESIDFPTERLGQFFSNHYLSLAVSRRPLSPDHWDDFTGVRHKLLSLPKSQVYEIAKAGVYGGWPSFNQALARLRELIGKYELEACQNLLVELFTVDKADCQIWPWVRLAELWDYLDGSPGHASERHSINP